jgi:phosphonate degradation associated HDIG domain protein
MLLSADRVVELLAERGGQRYGGEAVSQLEHALQCARLAAAAGEPDSVVAAALMHDLGHLLADVEVTATLSPDDCHQYVALPYLRSHFGPDVLEPIRLHVDAKRYLCHVDAGYWASLSAPSKQSLEWQGGVFDDTAAAAFIAQPHAAAAARLRRYDDLAKVPHRATPSLEHYATVLRRVAGS